MMSREAPRATDPAIMCHDSSGRAEMKLNLHACHVIACADLCEYLDAYQIDQCDVHIRNVTP